MVVAMICLPVLAVTAADVIFRTDQVDAVEALPWTMGAADARVTALGRQPILQNPGTGDVVVWYGDEVSAGEPWTAGEVESLLPAGSRLLPIEESGTHVRVNGTSREATLIGVDLTDPLVTGMYSLIEGRAPDRSGEVAVTRALAGKGAHLGATIDLGETAREWKVVGIVEQTGSADPGAFITPGALPAADAAGWLVDSPEPLDLQAVQQMNEQGLAVTSRALVLDPPPRALWDPDGQAGYLQNSAEKAVAALVLTAILLEVILLAGPAFAVGVRRQRRDLGLLAATGGAPADLRRVVLASGLVLGGGSAVLGAVLGAVLAPLAFGFVEQINGSPIKGPYDLRVNEIALVVAAGTFAGLAAAYLPARQAARTDVVAALTGRRRDAASRLRFPVVGALLVAAGVGVILTGAQQGELQIAAGTVVAVAGMVVAMPWLVGLVGRAAGTAPFPLRFALRDAGRNRGRTAPAVTAIMATVTGVTALAIGGASDFAEARLTYMPSVPVGSAYVPVLDADSDRPDETAAIVAAAVPDRSITTVNVSWNAWPVDPDCPGSPGALECRYPLEELAGIAGFMTTDVAVASPNLLEVVVPEAGPSVAAALRDGKAVAFNSALVRNDQVTLAVAGEGGDGDLAATSSSIPAVAADAPVDHGVPGIIVPTGVAAALGIDSGPHAVVVDGASKAVTAAEAGRIEAALEAAYGEQAPMVMVERGFQETFTLPLVLLGCVGAFLVLVATLTAAGLARSDARPDLATLSAVGASPRSARAIAMGQAAVVAVLGSAVGLAIGFIPGIAVTYPLTTQGWRPGGAGEELAPVIDIPWSLLGGLVVAVPLLALLVVGLTTRSPQNLTRRIA